MSIIGELAENIYKYGNCKLYDERCYLWEVYVIEFFVDEDGALKVIPKIECYDEKFWDGDKKNVNATLKETKEIVFDENNELPNAISYIIHTGLYINKKRKMITYEDVSPKANTNMALRNLYQIIYSMFQISPHEILNWGGNIEYSAHMLTRGRNAFSFNIEEVNSLQAIKNIDVMMKKIDSMVSNINNIREKYYYCQREWENTKYYGYRTTMDVKDAMYYKTKLSSFSSDHENIKFDFDKKDEEKKNGKSKLIIIAAIGKNNELGKDNDLIWRSKEDMKFFRETTIGHTIVMGRNTFESLPKVLPNRTHIVLTGQDIALPEGVIKCGSIEEFMALANTIEDDIYIIGGAMVYTELMSQASKMYLTEFDASCPSASVYFPEILETEWESEVIGEDKDNEPPYLRKVYTRKND